MRSRPPPASPRVSAVLLVVVALALCVGAAASLVASAASAPSYQPGPIQDVYLTGAELGYIFLAAFLFVVGLLVWIWYDRRRSSPGSILVGGLVLVLALLLFFALLHFATPTGGSQSIVQPSPGNNNTTTPGTQTNNSTAVPVGTPGGSLGFGGVQIPWTLIFVVVAVVGLVAAAVLAPALWRRGQDPTARRRAARLADIDRAQSALRTAAASLDAGGDPREVIIRLYGTLLSWVAPMVGSVDVDTPEEIRLTHLVALGIHPSPAATLTRLFEEARYSTHPMASDAAARAREAIAIAREDLVRAWGAV
jgi:hypothetical protein